MTISKSASYVSLKVLLFTEKGRPLGLLQGKDGKPHIVHTVKTKTGNLDFGIKPHGNTHFYYGSLKGKKIFYLFLLHEKGGERAQFPLHPQTKTPLFPTLQEKIIFPKDFEGELIWPKNPEGTPSFPCTEAGSFITPLDREKRSVPDPAFGEKEYLSFLKRTIQKTGSCQILEGSFSKKAFRMLEKNFPMILQVKYAFFFREHETLEIFPFPEVKKEIVQYCEKTFSFYGVFKKKVEREDASFVIFSIRSSSVKEGHFLSETCEETDQKGQ